jgi:hypothetical protein
VTPTPLTPEHPRTPTPLIDEHGATHAILTRTTIERYADDPIDAPSGTTLILACGDHHAADPDPSEAGMLSWLSSAWDAFDTACRRAIDAANARDHTLVVHPAAGGRLSDAVCTRAWIGRMGDDAPMLLADPIGWITPSMLSDAEDHLVRFVDACNELGVWGLRVRSCERSGDALTPCAVGSGDLDPSIVTRTLDAIDAPRRVLWA